jgi:alpha-beta hydrolase superfamily lysophospholipase
MSCVAIFPCTPLCAWPNVRSAINSPGKRYVELAEGTHTIIMEKNRLRLFEAVQGFLEEANRS